MARVEKLTAKRKASLSARTREPGRDEAWWRAFFALAASSAFLRGERGREGWKGADIDFLTSSEDRVVKVLERKYHARDEGSPATRTAPETDSEATERAEREADERKREREARIRMAVLHPHVYGPGGTQDLGFEVELLKRHGYVEPKRLDPSALKPAGPPVRHHTPLSAEPPNNGSRPGPGPPR